MERHNGYTHLELIGLETGERELIALSHPSADESVKTVAMFNNMKLNDAWQALYEGQQLATFGYIRQLVKESK